MRLSQVMGAHPGVYSLAGACIKEVTLQLLLLILVYSLYWCIIGLPYYCIHYTRLLSSLFIEIKKDNNNREKEYFVLQFII